MRLHQVAAKAILVSDDGDRKNAVFLPLSQLTYVHASRGIVTVTLPEWLARDRGLI